MKVLLVYPPFCTPASPPYSLVKLYGFLRKNLDKNIGEEKSEKFSLEILDLNAFFHNIKWKKYGDYFRTFTKNYDPAEYERTAKAFLKESALAYADNNKKVIREELPELFEEVMGEILRREPDLVAMSAVYSSQVFYGYALLKELKKRNIKTIVGGPAVNKKLREVASLTLNNEVELLEEITGIKIDAEKHDKLNTQEVLDFSILSKTSSASDSYLYFTPEIVLPLRTSISCYYQQCTFCTHHGNKPYRELSLQEVKESILISGAKKVFFIDDMIHKKRLLEIAELLVPLQVSWICQLRPTKDLDAETLQILHNSGLKAVIWGLESGSDRILQLMKKGTNIADAKIVLKNSAKAGIKNCLYILFGFPTESREEFKETLNFIREHKEITSLVLSTIFGLQQGAPILENPEEYSISKINFQERTILEPKISYQVNSGLTQEEATSLRKRYKKFLSSFPYPSAMNFFREHILCV